MYTLKFRQPVIDHDNKFEGFEYWGYVRDGGITLPNSTERKDQQYIGIKDRFGKEIYVGDIVLATTAFQAIYNESSLHYTIGIGTGAFVLLNENGGEVEQWNDGHNRWYSLENVEIMEVVGNIYEGVKKESDAIDII
jgi:uncharacterized phage protein (TIGR01671 family)